MSNTIFNLLAPIRRSPLLPQIIEELEQLWQEEQKRRHDFWSKHDEYIKAEFIEGEILLYHSPVYGRHWMASTNLLGYLIPFVRENQLGKVAIEKAMIRCNRNDYEPDICFWGQAKSLLFEPKQSVFPPPDFIIEILSESTEARDRGVKMIDYALHQVQEYWLIDTEKNILKQYFLADDVFVLHQAHGLDSVVQSRVISGFTISIQQVLEGMS